MPAVAEARSYGGETCRPPLGHVIYGDAGSPLHDGQRGSPRVAAYGGRGDRRFVAAIGMAEDRACRLQSVEGNYACRHACSGRGCDIRRLQ
ncbi:hypothetical protein NPIL_299601 [Nephila pilipes]|uniref:Uncharacterized protein n=1 Tax=Nephila pilipes TaxID=299642 RepID=A0A8X6MU44_NEPPI|nr:hypothetical protein NPIL_299601 [Nephila pilipes]